MLSRWGDGFAASWTNLLIILAVLDLEHANTSTVTSVLFLFVFLDFIALPVLQPNFDKVHLTLNFSTFLLIAWPPIES